MRKISVLVSIVILCLFGTTACSKQEEGNISESSASQSERETEISQEVEQHTMADDSQANEEEKGLTSEAKKMIEELGGTREGEVLVTYFDYADRIIYNCFVMTDDKVDFYTHVFYYTKEAYEDELGNKDHYGQIVENDDKARYICTLINTKEYSSYTELYEDKSDYGVVVE